MKHCKWNVCSAVWSIWHSSCEEIECPEWHKWFKEGRENIGDVEGSCYPEMHRSDKNTSTLSYLVRQGNSTSQSYICRSTGEVTWNCAQERSWTLAQQVVLPSWLVHITECSVTPVVGKEILLDWNSPLIRQIGHVALSKINVHPQGMKILGQRRCSERSDGNPEGHSKRVS